MANGKRMNSLTLLKKSRVNKDTHCTHVGMGSEKGRYSFNRETIDSIYNDVTLDPLIGLAEKPLDYSMLRFDLDFSSSDLERTDEFDLEEITNNALQHMRSFLTKHCFALSKKSNLLDCSILTKPSYINDKNKRKYGVHGQFHNLFINTNDFTFFENSMKPLIAGFDKICSNPWLLYGQQKSDISGTYTISYVDVGCKKISPNKYFCNYAIYDIKEEQIPFATPFDHYKQIFSIIPFNRKCTDFKPRKEVLVKPKEVPLLRSIPDDLSETLIEATKYVELLGSYRMNSGRKEWFYIGGILYTISNGDEAFFQLWNELSTQSADYNEEECIRTWKSMKCLPYLKMEQLRKMAEFDNPTKFPKEKKEFTTMKLDNIHADEVINQNNIGSYLPRLAKSDIVFVRSNMMTYKTQNLKELLPLYKRILVVSFRVSLLNTYVDTFGGFDFKMYSSINGKITEDKILVQIDSLFRVIGEFDLIIFDEAVYTLEHLNNFVKRRHEVWDALTQQIQSAKKIIVCDALLDNATIDVFKKAKGEHPSTWIVDNQWQSFKGKNIRYIKATPVQNLITHITIELKKYGSIYVPTNSKKLGIKLYGYFKAQGIRVGLDSSDNKPTPPDRWRKDYEVFISTPTNVAGVSCNDAFGKTIGYCTSDSCNPRIFSQMINRVRNTDSKEIDIFYKTRVIGYNPTKIDDIKAYIKESDELMFHSGLKINYIRDEIIEDAYYNQYISHVKTKNQGNKWYLQMLKGVMEHHGFESIDYEINEEESDYNLKALTKVKDDTKIIYEANQDEIRIAICNSKDISEKQVKEIKEKYQKTQDEKLQVRKFNLMKAYQTTISGTPRILTSPFIKKYENIINHFYNLRELNIERPDMLKYYIEHQYDKFLNENSNAPNTERLHESHRLLKLWTAHNIVKALGFQSIWDKKDIEGYPYDKAIEFLDAHGHKISVLFGKNDKTKWKELDLEDSKVKKKITETLNTVLKNVCSIGVKRKDRNSDLFSIQGLDIWESGDIRIDYNERAIDLQNRWFILENDILCKKPANDWKKLKEANDYGDVFDKLQWNSIEVN